MTSATADSADSADSQPQGDERSLHVRPAMLQDAARIVEFNRRLAWETEQKPLDPEVLSKGVAALFGAPSRGRYYVAEQAGEIVGQCMITYEWSDWRNGEFWWLQSVYVAEEARRGGVFRALLDCVRTLAERTEGVVGLRLYVETGNARAVSAYERLGFHDAHYQVMELSFPKLPPSPPTA